MNTESFDERLSLREVTAALHEKELIVQRIIEEQLEKRGSVARSGNDDKIFMQFHTLIALAVQKGLQRYIINVFRDINQSVLEFERNHKTEVHKGSLYFNIALCYLWSGDFDFALYYWSAAEIEDRKTYKKATNKNFTEELFSMNFGRIIEEHLEKELKKESSLVQMLYGHAYSFSDFKSHIKQLPSNLSINLLINLYKAIRYQDMNYNDAVNTLYYRLLADYSIFYESSLKEYLERSSTPIRETLGKILFSNLDHVKIGDISTEWRNFNSAHKCSSIIDLNTEIYIVENEIDSSTTPVELAARINHLILIIRNTVTHRTDTSAVIYNNRGLCERIIRFILIANLYSQYI